MRDEKEGRKKQAKSNKQTRQSNTAHPRQSLFLGAASSGTRYVQDQTSGMVLNKTSAPTPPPGNQANCFGS